MPVELRELYVEAAPLINRAIENVLSEQCDIEWLNKVSRGVGQHWDVEIIQKTLFEPFNYYLKNGGKRYRPFVTYMVLKAFDQKPDPYLPILAISEFLHVASLICDDVADNSRLRRGRPTAHLVYGLPVVINLAFTMAHYPGVLIDQIKLSENIRRQLYTLLNWGIFSSCVGIAGDVIWPRRPGKPVPDSQILQHMIDKTCPLTFVVPAMLGAILASAPERVLVNLKGWGTYTGAMYQIVDDMLNLRPLTPEWGKEWAEDLNENKRTLLMSHARQRLKAHDLEKLDQLLEQKVLTDDNKTEIVSLMDKTGAFEYASRIVQLLLKKAIQSLGRTGLPMENVKPLKLFAELVASRDF